MQASWLHCFGSQRAKTPLKSRLHLRSSRQSTRVLLQVFCREAMRSFLEEVRPAGTSGGKQKVLIIGACVCIARKQSTRGKMYKA